jgi:rhodanese-related sulfurtransferase
MSLPPLVEPAAELSVDEVRRYSRHLIIPDVGVTGQKRLKNARVLVVGAGGLGSPALLYLAAAGVGTLGIVEFDTVDESNLQRQVIHGQSDIGRPKAESARGSIQVTEAIKLLAGIGEPLLGSLMVYDALEMTYRKIKVRKDPNCAICGENPTVTELIDYDDFCGAVSEEAQSAVVGSTITATELHDWLDSGKSIDLIDVREPAEWEIVRIPGAHLVPKGEFLNGTALADLPQDKQIVLYCKTGVRSAEALAAVKAAGFRDAVHVQGGVVSWIKTVDPSLPIY